MNPIKKILAPTDFSPAAESALDEAVGLARAMGATVTLMNAYQLPPSPPDALVGFGADVIDALEEAARQRLDRARAALRERTADCPPIEIKVALGAAPAEIVAEARRGRYDLVVMGTHGRTGVKHLLIGSVAERVVRLCPIPVLTVHPTVDGTATASTPTAA